MGTEKGAEFFAAAQHSQNMQLTLKLGIIMGPGSPQALTITLHQLNNDYHYQAIHIELKILS